MNEKILTVSLPGRSYHIEMERGLLSRTGERCRAILPSAKRLFVVTDVCVASLYGSQVEDSLKAAGFQVRTKVIPAGEESKNAWQLAELWEEMMAFGLTRTDAVIALGGGVVGDLAGFAAATILRGVGFVQIPTTLLAQVDASVGGKVAIDLRAGKNLAGAFWQPSMVFCDYHTFDSLPPAKLMDGIAEAVKCAAVSEESLLPHIRKKDYEYVIERCVSIKKSIVEADERDTGLRQILNFGHTVGHGIEKLSSFSVSHGQAVAKGLIVEARAAYRFGLAPVDIASPLQDILAEMGFDLSVDYSPEEIYQYALMDKKIMGDKITMVIPESLGKCRLHKISLSELQKFIRLGMKE